MYYWSPSDVDISITARLINISFWHDDLIEDLQNNMSTEKNNNEILHLHKFFWTTIVCADDQIHIGHRS